MTSRFFAPLIVVACVFASAPASAFCIATTCDRTQDACALDEHQCNLEGVPLHWDGGKTALNVASGGSPLRDITEDELLEATTHAVASWTDAVCEDGKHPALRFPAPLLEEGVTVAFDEDGANESIVAFFDDQWPFAVGAIGKTALGFFESSGNLDDADIALNSKDYSFSVSGDGSSDGEGATDNDLEAVLTHEIGHVLGLDHSDSPGATMQPEAKGFASVKLRSLEQDDVDAICSLYPPVTEPTDGGSEATPSHHDDGGCTVSSHVARAPRETGPTIAWAAVCALALRLRSRRPKVRGQR